MRMRTVPIQGTQTKAIVSIPGWAEYRDSVGSTKLTKTDQAYSKVALTFRAVKLRCDALTSIPYRVTQNGNEAEWPFDESFKQLLWWTEASLLLAGAGYWLRKTSRTSLLGPQWLNPFTMEVKRENKRLIFKQTINGQEYGPWTEDQIVYFRTFNPTDDVGPGIAAADLALEDSATLRHMSLFVNKFFADGAMPVTLLGLAGNPPKEEVERVENRFKQMMTGIRNAFKVIGVRADALSAAPLQAPMDTLAMPEVREAAVQNTAWAFGVPLTMLLDAANYATAREHRISFYTDTVIPQLELYAHPINTFLSNTGYEIEFLPNEHETQQADEAERASSLSMLTNAGVPLELAMEMLGYELPEGWDYEKLKKYLEDKQKQAMENAMAMASAGKDDKGEKDSKDNKDPKDEKKADLERWQRKALKRLKQGKPPDCAFNSDFLTLEETDFIHSLLSQAQDEQGVEEIFRAILQLDPDDDEAEREARMSTEKKAISDVSIGLKAQYAELIPEDFDPVRDGPFLQTKMTESTTVRDALRRALVRGTDLGVSIGFKQLENVGLAFDWTLANLEARDWANNYAGELAQGINSTTLKVLQQSISEWINNGDPIEELFREIEPLFGRNRAELIAVTEVTRAYAEGSRVAWRTSGVIEQIQWRTARDEQVCPICGGLNGKRTDLDGDFDGYFPPAHPRCRCWVVAYIPEEPQDVAANRREDTEAFHPSTTAEGAQGPHSSGRGEGENLHGGVSATQANQQT